MIDFINISSENFDIHKVRKENKFEIPGLLILSFEDKSKPSLKFTTKKNTILVMDNKDYNQTYVKDLFDTYYEVCDAVDKAIFFERMQETVLYYIDDPYMRFQLLNPTKDIPKDIERNISPCIMTYNHVTELIGINSETFAPLTIESVEDAMNFLFDNNER